MGGGKGNGELLVKEYKLPFIRLTSSRDLMYSMVIIANNIVSYTWMFSLQKRNGNYVTWWRR